MLIVSIDMQFFETWCEVFELFDLEPELLICVLRCEFFSQKFQHALVCLFLVNSEV